jgi:hypothetical protein
MYTRRKDNIKMEIREKRWGDTNWIHLAQDRGQESACVIPVKNP